MSSSLASAGGAGATRPPSTSTIVAEMETGSHVLKVDGHSGIKGHRVTESVKCGKFGAGGHSWYIRYFPCGTSKENADWVSIFVYLDHRHPGAAKDAVVKARRRLSLLDQGGKPVRQHSKCRVEGLPEQS